MRGRTVALAVAALAALPGHAAAHHVELPSELQPLEHALPTMSPGVGAPAEDVHSDNMALLANLQAPFADPTPGDGENPYESPAGSDLAFWGDLAVQGIYDRPGGIRLIDISDPEHPSIAGQKACPGPQGDVSIWEDLVFMSVDSPRTGTDCEEGATAAPTSQFAAGEAHEGVRIFDVSDPAHPEQITLVDTDCGSHTHTLVPDAENRRVFVYVLSYPLGAPAVNCSAASHRKISVIEVPLDDPAAAKVVSTPDVSPAIGCHDVTVHLERSLALAACLTESQVWDISDKANPRVVSHITNPAINIHHSSAFAWDGETAVIGDELGGAAAAAGCFDPHLPLGALWFYDVSDPAAPKPVGNYHIPEDEQRQVSLLCTAHNFNTVPLRDRDVLVSGWYNGGTTVLDFSDPSAPEQLGWYIAADPVRASNWASYFYNGRIYVNNFDASYVPSDPRSRGFDVMAIDHPALEGALELDHLNAQVQEPLPEE